MCAQPQFNLLKGLYRVPVPASVEKRSKTANLCIDLMKDGKGRHLDITYLHIFFLNFYHYCLYKYGLFKKKCLIAVTYRL